MLLFVFVYKGTVPSALVNLGDCWGSSSSRGGAGVAGLGCLVSFIEALTEEGLEKLAVDFVLSINDFVAF